MSRQVPFGPLHSNRSYPQGGNLRHCDLTGADMQAANLRNANLTGAILDNSNLYGADLRWAVYDQSVVVSGGMKVSLLALSCVTPIPQIPLC